MATIADLPLSHINPYVCLQWVGLTLGSVYMHKSTLAIKDGTLAGRHLLQSP